MSAYVIARRVGDRVHLVDTHVYTYPEDATAQVAEWREEDPECLCEVLELVGAGQVAA